LNLQCRKVLSTFAITFKLRRYSMAVPLVCAMERVLTVDMQMEALLHERAEAGGFRVQGYGFIGLRGIRVCGLRLRD